MTKVDVVITCYNKEETIVRAIESVKQQTLKDFLCIVVDDGSTDNSWQVINQSIENDDRFAAIRLKNCGVANARNTGISYGNAPYITCLDGDDGLQPEFLETCYNAISKETNVGIVYTDILLHHIDEYFTVARWPDAEPEKQFEGHNQIPCCNMFRRDIFERVGGYNQRYAPKGAGAEDAELWLRFFKLGYHAKKITSEPLFIYNTYGGITQNAQYKEVNWLNWHTTKTFASLASPDNNIAHPIHERDNPLISIIIPVGPGHEHYLVDALDSVEAQTFQNWEAIVVFDQSQTHKNKYINRYKKAYPYVKFVWTEKPHGAGYARNIGVNHAHGKYLCFLDCDDYLQPKFLQYTLGAIEHFDADWIYTDLYTQVIYNEEQFNLKVNSLDTQGLMHKILRRKGNLIEFIYPYQCDEWSIEKLWTSGIAAVTGLYRKKDFELINGFDEKENREDWDFHMRLAKAGKCGLRLPLPLFTYRLHTGIRREYKDVAKNSEESQALKQMDVDRIHRNYNLKELQMACTNCKKNKINIQPAREEDLDTLEYIGKVKGGSIRGVTGKMYSIEKAPNGVYFIQKVHPQDSQEFIRKGIFKPIQREKPRRNVIVSSTPQKVEVRELTHAERIRRSNEFAMKTAQEAREYVERMFAKRTTNENTEPNANNDEIVDWWYNSEETYKTIAILKQTIEQQENITQEQLQKALEYERNNKNRKGAIAYLKGLLDI